MNQKTWNLNDYQEFRREGSDLHMVQRIGLVEALCGFQMTVAHLDGRQLLVKYPPGKIIEPGTHWSIQSIFCFYEFSYIYCILQQ